MKRKPETASTILGLTALVFLLSLFSGCDRRQDNVVGTSIAALAEPQPQCSGDCSKGCNCEDCSCKSCNGQCDEGCTCPCEEKGGCGGECDENCTCPHKGGGGCDGQCGAGCTCKKGGTCSHK